MSSYKSPFGTDLLESKCQICGIEYSQVKKGRFKQYCSTDCANVFKYISALDRALTKIIFRDIDKLKMLRGDIFSMANHLPKKVY